MKDLIFSEWRRFRWVALAAFTMHLLVLLFLNRVTNLLQQSFREGLPMLLIFMGMGLVLAVVQIGSYRKPSQWAWLIHRPLAPSHIFAALSLSALLLLTFAIFMPMFLLLLGTDLFTTRVVDLRHYLMAVHLLAFALIAWTAGAHACVSRSRVAIAVLFAPLLLALHLVSTVALLLPVSLALGWLYYITLRSFRANRDAPIAGTATLLATALPLQLSFFLLCVVLWRFFFVTGSILMGVDPLNTDYPPEGGLIATERADPSDEIALGLAKSKDPRATSWREQLPLLEPLRIRPSLRRFPVRQLMSNLERPSGWYDEERQVFWTFSHDRMLFIGRDPQSGAARGVFGLQGEGDTAPFDRIPVVTDGGDLLAPHALYGVDKDTQKVILRWGLKNGEQFTAMPHQEFGRLLILTNQRLLVLREDRRSAASIKPLVMDWELVLPGGPQHLDFVSLVELMDGWLVSFVYDNGMRQIGFNQFNVVAQPWQQVQFVDADGAGTVVGERVINADFPALHRSDWWLSPPLEIVTTIPEAFLKKGLTWPMRLTLLPQVPALQIAAVLMLLLSTGIAWWWLRGAGIPRARRRVWLASCALLGLPALLSLFLLEPRDSHGTEQ